MPKAKSVQTEEKVRKTSSKTLEETKREEERKIVQEAAYVVSQINEVLRRLRDDDLEGAKSILEELASRTDKLCDEYKDIDALPIRTEVFEVVGVEDPEEAERLLQRVKEHLEEGDIPAARDVINAMRNEIVVDTFVMPLAVLRDAIRLAKSLLERGNVGRLIDTLSLLTSSVETVETIFPKPLLEAYYLVDEISKSQEADRGAALELIDEVRKRLRLARVLGYVRDEKEISDLLERVEKIEAGLKEEKSQAAEIEALRDRIKEARERAGKRAKVKAKG